MNQTVYVCTGGCNGVSTIAKGCGAESCAHYEQPLEPRVQCDACVKVDLQDGKAHACSTCAQIA